MSQGGIRMRRKTEGKREHFGVRITSRTWCVKRCCERLVFVSEPEEGNTNFSKKSRRVDAGGMRQVRRKMRSRKGNADGGGGGRFR